MIVKIQQFLGTLHSWSIVGQNIARSLIKKNHEVHLISTNGYKYFPDDLKPFVVNDLRKEYDMQISYTAMKNFPAYLGHGVKNRFGIWNYETSVLPKGFAKFYKFTDKIMPSSEFATKIFADNKVPLNYLKTIPHGINVEEYSSKEVYKLKTDKKYKILANIAQPHIRKNIDGLFESFGRAFTKQDDVCLVIKVSVRGKDESKSFDVDFWSIYNKFVKKFKNHAEVEIITDFLPSMVPLYNACNIVYSVTHAECFWLPGLEGLATNNLVIAPNWGGQLEFLNKDNSLLIDGKEVRADKKMQYWADSPYAVTFKPDLDHAASLLQHAIKNYDSLMSQFEVGINYQLNRLTWDNVVDQIIDTCE